MKSFEYACPASLDEAIAILSDGRRARLLAGGTDLIVQLREHRVEADVVVDIKRIAELDELSLDGDGLVIGAAVPCCRIAEDERIARAYPAVADAASLIGGIQIQSRASLGGNLCNASPAADGVPPLIVHGAVCRIAGPGGEREVPVESFCVGPGKTVLAPGELLVSLRLPPVNGRSGSSYERFIPRNEMDIAVAGAASFLELEEDGETIRRARVALAAVAPTPLLVEEAGRLLAGRKATSEAYEAAAEAARRAARPISDMRGEAWQRRHLAGVLTRRTLERAWKWGHSSFSAKWGHSSFSETRNVPIFEKSGMSPFFLSGRVNGEPVELLCEPRQSLLEVLRDELGLTGTKEGCNNGNCGACSVILDGRLVNACLVLAPEIEGRSVTTIEGIATAAGLHPIQRKFLEHAALQCGVCTPGFIVAARALLERNPRPTEADARLWLAGNLCRCTGYDKIIRAVLDAAEATASNGGS